MVVYEDKFNTFSWGKGKKCNYDGPNGSVQVEERFISEQQT